MNTVKFPQIVLVLFMILVKQPKKYTYWNIIFILLGKPFKINPEIHLVNSSTIWSCFHIGGTNNAKTRFIAEQMDRNLSINAILKFIVGDILLHLLPALYWINYCWKRKMLITNNHIFNFYISVFSFLASTSKSLYCKEYGNYPYKRHLLNLAIFPTGLKYVYNYSIKTNNRNIIIILYFYTWYLKEYFDIYDGSRLLEKKK